MPAGRPRCTAPSTERCPSTLTTAVVSEVLGQAQSAVAGWGRVLDVLDLPPEVAEPADGQPPPPGALDVRFDGSATATPARQATRCAT
jgi:hypothetical protein